MFHLLASASPLLAQMGHHMDMDGGGWFWVWISLMIIAGIVLLAGLIYVILRAGGSGHAPLLPQSQMESPLDIAKRRYASGEITAEEFERIKTDLKA